MLNKSLTILIGLCLLVSLIGCEPEIRVVRSSWDNFPADPKPSQGNGGHAYQDPAGGQGWTIQLIQLEGRDRHDRAKRIIEYLRTETKLANLWIEDHGDAANIYQGRFAEATDPAIRPAIAQIKDVEIDGEKPFNDCQLIPLVGDGRVIADPFDLRQFVGYYSLQIGFYNEHFGPDFRNAAEDAVRILREEGHEAYYYHGPFRSLITIGVFSYDQAFVRAGNVDTYAPQVRELQKKFPYNLGNGVTILQKENGRDIGEQKSSLIRVF